MNLVLSKHCLILMLPFLLDLGGVGWGGGGGGWGAGPCACVISHIKYSLKAGTTFSILLNCFHHSLFHYQRNVSLPFGGNVYLDDTQSRKVSLQIIKSYLEIFYIYSLLREFWISFSGIATGTLLTTVNDDTS